MIAGLVHLAGGRLALDGGEPDASIAEQAHYLGHQDAVKPSLTVGENLQFWARYLGGIELPIDPALAGGRPRAARQPAGGLSVGRATAAAVDRAAGRGAAAALAAGRADLGARRAVARPAGRFDAQPPRRRRHDRGRRARADRARTRPRTEDRAGMSAFIALVRPRHAARRSRRRRRADGRAVLPDRGDHDAVRARPRPRSAGAHRPGDPVARRLAGEPARARPAVRHRPRRRIARPLDDGPHAARTGGGGQGHRALADHRVAAGGDQRRCSASCSMSNCAPWARWR